MNEFLEQLQRPWNLSQETLNVIAGISILWGVINCFFGYRIFKVVLGILGFITGAAVGAAVGGAASGQEAGMILGGLVGGVLGAALFVLLYFLGIFLMGAGVGVLLGGVAAAALKVEAHPALLLVPAVLCGILALALQKLLIILSTAFGGSWSVVSGVFRFVSERASPFRVAQNPEAIRAYLQENALMLGFWLVLGVVGVVVQYSTGPSAVAGRTDEERRAAEPAPAQREGRNGQAAGD